MSTLLSELSIVLPCYNEEKNIERVLREAHDMAKKAADRFELVIVDDGSTDTTAERILKMGLSHVHLIRHPRNQGYGAALRSGFRTARYSWIFYTDGDGQFDFDQLLPFLSRAKQGQVLVGYRHPRADGSLIRTFNGRAWTWLSNFVLGLEVRDVNCAYKLFPRDLIARIPMMSGGASIDAELLLAAMRLEYPIAELPVRHRPRLFGQATGARPAVILRALGELVRLRTQWAPLDTAPAE